MSKADPLIRDARDVITAIRVEVEGWFSARHELSGDISWSELERILGRIDAQIGEPNAT